MFDVPAGARKPPVEQRRALGRGGKSRTIGCVCTFQVTVHLHEGSVLGLNEVRCGAVHDDAGNEKKRLRVARCVST